MNDRRNPDENVDVRERSVRDTVDPRDSVEPRDTAESRDTVEPRDTTRVRTADRPRDTAENGASESFLPPDRMEEFRERWDDIQAGFVDDPRNSVQKAHGLVSSLVNDLNEVFTRERSGLESQWNRGEDADTEDLRVALRRYRAFFNRLLR